MGCGNIFNQSPIQTCGCQESSTHARKFRMAFSCIFIIVNCHLQHPNHAHYPLYWIYMFLTCHFEKEMVVSDVRNICDIENQYHGQNLSKGNIWPHLTFFCHIPYSIKTEICDHVNLSLKGPCIKYVPRGALSYQPQMPFFSCFLFLFFFIGPESDHCLPLSLTY